MKTFYEFDDTVAIRMFVSITKNYDDLNDVHVAQSSVTFNWVERGWVKVVELRNNPPTAVMKLTDEGHALLAFKDL